MYSYLLNEELEQAKESFKELEMYTNPELFKEIEMDKKKLLKPEDYVDKIGRENRKEGIKEAFKMFGYVDEEDEGITL